ncbi:MAG: rRNA maturation RNase YbeY [Candidatus Izemoplasma sp.]|nr:rRNA maturation RNase YbeY [Candidatus Izemoplasma sp.]
MRINIINSYDEKNYLTVLDPVFQKASNMLHLESDILSIVLVDNKTIHDMNKTYRHKDYATDVLSFPDGENHHLGDVIISIDKCHAQALEYEHSFERELCFLAVHGLLHCLGYDHQTNEEESEMDTLAQSILNQSNIRR